MNYRAISGIVAAFAVVSAPAAADGGLYLGAGLGSAGVSEEYSGFAFDDDVAAYRFLAGLQFGDILGVEAGYQSFGDFEETISVGGATGRARLAADGWTLGGTLSVPVSEFVSVFARGGVFVWDAYVDVNGIRAALDDDSNPYYGAGAKVGFNRNFSLVGDWTRFELDWVETDVFSLGFEYRFGN